MSGHLATRDATEADYDAIQDAVMETDRGRWFLAEFARRNRHAETEGLLASLARIESAVVTQREPNDLDRFRLNVLEMSRAIARTRAEIAAIKPAAGDGRIVEASGELESIVSATEAATSDILAAAENVQEVAWTLRESGGDIESCNRLDQHAVAIYTACSFQDLTAQRTRKVTEILSFLESRVNAMADIWQFAAHESPADAPSASVEGDAADPSMSQSDVDDVLVAPVETADFELELTGQGYVSAPLAVTADASIFVVDPEQELAAVGDEIAAAMPPFAEVLQPAEVAHPDTVPIGSAADTHIDDILFDRPRTDVPPLDITGELRVVTPGPAVEAVLTKARAGQTLTPDEAATALDALKGMSIEDRTRLFS
jgi:hypothetical protein